MMRVVDVRLFASVVALVATSAMAQAPAPVVPAPTDPPASGQPTGAPVPSAASTNPRLAPGGIAGGAAGFPVSVNFNMSNAASTAWLAPGYQRQPNWGTSLDARMGWRLPNADGLLPNMRLTARMIWNVNNWLPAFSNTDVFERTIRFSDLRLGLVLPGLSKDLFHFGEWANFDMTPILGVRVPISVNSRANAVLFIATAGIQFAWNSPEVGPFGTLFAQYIPFVLGTSHYRETFIRLAQDRGATNTPGDASGHVCRAEERVGADCLVPSAGQNNLLFDHTLIAGWNSPGEGAHNVSVSLGSTTAFRRPFATKPELNSENTSAARFTTTTNGGVSYSYTVPVDFQLIVGASVSSEQPILMVGNAFGDTSPVFYVPRFPFWDFVTPANGFSSASLDLTVGF
jgi:hypothetical protein